MSTFLYGANVQANGIRQHYLRYGGRGPTLILIPGIGACQGSCRLSRFMRPVFPAPDSATLLPAGSSFA
ncbi:alpha/beta fold hydrolase, partial [Serratia ficaria]